MIPRNSNETRKEISLDGETEVGLMSKVQSYYREVIVRAMRCLFHRGLSNVIHNVRIQ